MMKHLDGLFQASLTPGVLSTKEKELIVLGISAGHPLRALCFWFTWKRRLRPGRPKRRFWKRAGWRLRWVVGRQWPTFPSCSSISRSRARAMRQAIAVGPEITGGVRGVIVCSSSVRVS